MAGILRQRPGSDKCAVPRDPVRCPHGRATLRPRHESCPAPMYCLRGGMPLHTRGAAAPGTKEMRMFGRRRLVLHVVAAACIALGACRGPEKPAPPPPTSETPAEAPPTERVVGPLSEADAKALATMNDRLREYIDLHRRIEATLPGLPDNATPEQIDRNQRQFERKIREARRTAKPGDIFTPEARPVIIRLLAAVFSGSRGRDLKASIMDENPHELARVVNARYPDSVPLSTVPPEVLQTMPKLTEDLEYRFIGDDLILLDTHAHVVADFIADALPKDPERR